MSYCNNVSLIKETEFLGNSLRKINTNWSNLSSNICILDRDVRGLQTYINSLSVINSGAINLNFNPLNYSLSAVVKNNIISTRKLGQNIPQTTKVFLTGAKVSSLSDVQIVNNLVNENTIKWDGVKWINSTLVDEVGAKKLNELKDVIIDNTLSNNQILRYDSSLSAWKNVNDDGPGRIDNRLYEDILVSSVLDVPGQDWRIEPQKVNSFEISNNAITTSKISALQIVNSHFANQTIGPEKFSFSLGEINTGINKGSGQGKLVLETNQGTRIPFKKIAGAVGCTVNFNNQEIVISAQQPPPPTPPVGGNVGTGATVLRDITTTPTNAFYNIKTIKAGTDSLGIQNISITETNTEIIISRSLNLGLSILGVGPGGELFTDNDIKTRVTQIFPPDQFPQNTICNVEVEVPAVDNFNSIPINIPVSLSYNYKNASYSEPTRCISGCIPGYTVRRMIFKWIDPVQLATLTTTSKGFDIVPFIYSASKNITSSNSVASSNQPKLTATRRSISFTKIGNSWI
jgi:hypothetical protein